jgi:hypothetical protein
MVTVRRPVWRVLAWCPRRLYWVVQRTFDTVADANEFAESLRHRDPRRRVCIMGATMPPRLPVKPAVTNPTREFRLIQGGLISDRADALKRYKSPG